MLRSEALLVAKVTVSQKKWQECGAAQTFSFLLRWLTDRTYPYDPAIGSQREQAAIL